MPDPHFRAMPPDPVVPFFFGEPRLYGCLHGAQAGRRGVVICYPFGSEYIAIHRAARQLASQIARAGLPTLRFDYSGTGDSAGDLEDARLGRWIQEVGAAADELKERMAIDRVSLVGIRLGAALAYLAAAWRSDVDRIALWDPVMRGRRYLREIRRDHRRMLRVAHVRPARSDRGEGEVLGFPFPERLHRDLETLDLEGAPVPGDARFLLIHSGPSRGSPIEASLRAAGRPVESRTEDRQNLWRWEEDAAKIRLPHRAVSTIARWVVEEAQ